MGKKFLLPLLASLGLAAAVSVPAVVASVSQRDENAESVLNYNSKVRQDRFGYYYIEDGDGSALCTLNVIDTDDTGVLFDSVLPVNSGSDPVLWYSLCEDGAAKTLYFYDLAQDAGLSSTDLNLFVNGEKISTFSLSIDVLQPSGIFFSLDFEYLGTLSNDAWIVVGSSVVTSLNSYYDSHQVVSGIEAGLPFVSNAAQALVGGFDSMALDNGALTNVMAFSFTLLGLGCAVGICKKVFSWITGRHGM